ncbi:MAG: restriction endonuclease subunit S [Polyangiaceae bacterium]|nr:restriction endonuclease subunit S [Polyangiaceae bacterium]
MSICEWKKTSLGEVIALQRGYDLPEQDRNPGAIPVYGSFGITGYHGTARASAPGVTVGRSGASFGVVNYVPVPFWPHNTVLFVTDFKGNDPRFISYLLKTIDLRVLNSGSAQPSLNRNYVYNVPVRIPPARGQQLISDILSAYDDLIENNTKRIKILEEMARSLYREWFVNLCFPGHEKVKMVSSPLGKVPEGWRSSELQALVDDIRDSINPSEIDPNTPYFGLEHLPRRSLNLAEWGRAADVQSTKLRVKQMDILFGKIRPYFHKVGPSPIEGVCSSDTIVLRVRRAHDFGLAVAVTSSDEFVSHATQTSQGTKMPRANWDVLRRYPVVVPPEPLLSTFNDFVTQSVKLIHALLFKNRNLQATRDLLLPRLISGEIDVTKVTKSITP